MGDKLRKLTLAVLLAGSAAVLVAAPAGAMREPKPTTTSTEPSYVPPPKYGQNPHPDLPAEPDPYAGATPPVVPVVLPQLITDPGAPAPNPGDQNAGDNSGRGVAPGDKVQGESQTRPAAPAPSNGGSGIGGVLSRTGANTLPLVRAGLAALALGIGLVVLARRRRTGAASA